MANNKKTIFQKLNTIFDASGVNLTNINTQTQPSINKYSISNDILLKTQSKEEYETAKLQAQQSKFLGGLWKKSENELIQHSMHYETTRIGSYADFESMEFYPEIAAALDIFMEEASTLNSKGKVLNIFSESKRVQTILEDLFFNRLDIQASLPMWTRNLPVREDSIIPLLNGEFITIKEIAQRIKENPNETIWTYSVQDITNKIVPSKIIWCDLTRKNSQLVRVTLDDGTYLDTTPDHEYIMRDGSKKRADELIEGQSLMPFYTKISNEGKKIKGYELVFNPKSNRYRYTHRLIAEDCLINVENERSSGSFYVTHHIDFNKLNNSPDNLVRMTNSEHSAYHSLINETGKKRLQKPDVVEKRMAGIDKYLRSESRRLRLSKEMTGIYPKYFEEYNNSDLHDEHNKIRKNRMTELWSDEEYRLDTKNKMSLKFNDETFEYVKDIIKNYHGYISINILTNTLKEDKKFFNLFNESNTIRKDLKKAINSNTIKNILIRTTNKTYNDLILELKPEIINDKKYLKSLSLIKAHDRNKNKLINHKVVSVQFLDETSDVYCMEVVGKDNEQDRHNFPICSKDKNGNYTRNGVFVSNCKYGDNFLMLNLDDKKGIVGARQLPNFEIERKEGDVIYNQYSGEYKINNDSESAKVKFFWRGKDFEFNSWQIAHFRLLGDDRRLPYGTSLLEKARSIWKRLQLAEDAMLVYRITRAPERRVFKIYVGNIDDNDVPAYVDEIANRFKRKPVIDPQTGQIDLRYNQLANDQDYFIPVRDENAPTPIDTLPGANNLSDINDILFLQRKLFTALRVPKTFLGFEEATGDGKNLALQDIRFSRTINRIQQAVIAELNKIAIIHLYMLGFEDELSNFNLSLNNPSTQAEMLKIEQLQAKMSVYKDAITDAGNGFMGMSMTRARREILGWSDEEIRKDFLEQRLEKAAAAEIEQSSTVIKRTGIFDEVDALYGDMSASGQPTEGEDGGNESFGGGGGSFGGGSSSTPDFGTEETPEASEETPESGEEIPSIGGTETPEEGGEEATGTETEPLAERRGKGTNLINENVVSNNKKRLIERQSYVNKLLDNVNEEDKIIKEGVKIYDKNLKINEHINSIINDIDDMLKK